MSIKGINSSSGITPMSQLNQDNYEKNIQKQIRNLQDKVKSITNDREKSSEQKMDEKKALQEEIQSLNTELKQYQLQKRQEETAKKQETASRTAGDERSIENSSNKGNHISNDLNKDEQEKKQKAGFSETETGVLISISHTKDQLSYMQKVQTGLESRMRIAETEEEKVNLQERINNVSKSMAEKVKKITDKITETQEEEQERKEKVGKILQKQNEERKENINIILPTGGKKVSAENASGKENFNVPGKISIS